MKSWETAIRQNFHSDCRCESKSIFKSHPYMKFHFCQKKMKKNWKKRLFSLNVNKPLITYPLSPKVGYYSQMDNDVKSHSRVWLIGLGTDKICSLDLAPPLHHRTRPIVRKSDSESTSILWYMRWLNARVVLPLSISLVILLVPANWSRCNATVTSRISRSFSRPINAQCVFNDFFFLFSSYRILLARSQVRL